MKQHVYKRFESIENRFDTQQNLIVTLFGSVMALIMALMGYILWDRKTAQEPMKKKVIALEDCLKRQSLL